MTEQPLKRDKPEIKNVGEYERGWDKAIHEINEAPENIRLYIAKKLYVQKKDQESYPYHMGFVGACYEYIAEHDTDSSRTIIGVPTGAGKGWVEQAMQYANNGPEKQVEPFLYQNQAEFEAMRTSPLMQELNKAVERINENFRKFGESLKTSLLTVQNFQKLAETLNIEPEPDFPKDIIEQQLYQFKEWVREQARACLSDEEFEDLLIHSDGTDEDDHFAIVFLNDGVQGQWEAWQASLSNCTHNLQRWAVSRWEHECKQRPLENIYRRTLDDTWRQVLRFAGYDPEQLLGPDHDSLVRLEEKARNPY